MIPCRSTIRDVFPRRYFTLGPVFSHSQGSRRDDGSALLHQLLARRLHRSGDLASSAFYAGGAAEQADRKVRAWFVLGVMLFSFAVRSVYMESCSMFVRGGVYVVVRDSMGPVAAKFSVSSLVFDYILTGPISVVSAGQYLARAAQRGQRAAAPDLRIDAEHCSPPASAVLVTIYFWWTNIKGVHESSGKALRIMQITTVMVVILLIWCPLTHSF